MKVFWCIQLFVIGIFNLAAQCPVIPSPTVYQEGKNTITIAEELSVNPKDLPETVKSYLIGNMTSLFDLRVVFSPNGRQLEFRKLSNVPLDHYTITITDKIIIMYSSESSCFYAVNSLIQLIQEQDGQYFLKECFIQDQPRFSWRGLHLDVSRHFYSVDEVKRFIDLMAYYKFNTFHWHLTDDQGWRIEIKKYPKLTEVGAWRDSTLNNHYTTKPRTYTKERYGGFYTQEQIKEVVEYATKRYITVVPEIEMPGHARAALSAYPEYSCKEEQLGIPGLWGVFDDIFCAKEETVLFLQDILAEVIELFPSEYIHIGGDEAPKERWKACSKCQEIIQKNGLKDEHELQSYFIGRMDQFLSQHGKKLIGWDEILEGGLSPNAAVMSWRGFEGGMEAAKQKHYVVMSPGSHCYFDHFQSANSNEPLAIGGFTPLEKVYEFDPIAPGMSKEDAAYVLGGQANLWTEYIPSMKQLEYMTYPRALALSQALWCTNKPSFESFKSDLINFQLKFMEARKINFSKAIFYPKMEIVKKSEGVNIHFKSGEPNYHFDLFVKSDEVVPSMSGGQIVGVKDSLYFERTTESKVVNYKFRLLSEFNSEPTLFNLKVHPSLGLPVELVTKPNSRYSGSGELTLVDGIVGSFPWKGNEWLGFDTSSIEIIIDLKKRSKIKAVEMNFLKDEGSWIHTPSSVEIVVSKNKKKWKKISKQDPMDPIVVLEKFSRHFYSKGQYLKLTIKSLDQIPKGLPGEGQQPWTFIDELIIFYGE